MTMRRRLGSNGMRSAYLMPVSNGTRSKRSHRFHVDVDRDPHVRKPEHVGSATISACSATRRFVRRVGPKAMGPCGETEPGPGSERARRTRGTTQTLWN